MLLKKQEKGGIISALYNSSNVLASEYDAANNSLTVTFKVGSRYKYNGVTNADYTKFELDESQGIILNSHIKKYPFEKLTAIDAKLLNEEAATIKDTAAKQVVNDKKDKLIVTLKSAVSLSGSDVPLGLTQDDVDTMFNDSLEKLQTQITEFLTP